MFELTVTAICANCGHPYEKYICRPWAYVDCCTWTCLLAKRKADAEKDEQLKKAKNRKPRCKPVAQYTLDGKLVARYPSCKATSDTIGCHVSSISACCTGRISSFNGYVFRYEVPPE